MFIIKLLRYIKGYVGFTATGAFIERFLNLAARRRIPVWGGSKRGERYSGYTSANTYGMLHEPARKSGVRLKVTGKYGLPFRRRRYRRRKGLLFGILVFFLFLGTMNNFIWNIEVHGNETVSERRIIEVLEDCGVKVGTFSHTVNVREAEGRALLELPELSWIALNMDGSTIRVEVHEAVEPPEAIDPKTPCNVVSTGTGRIVSIHVYEGQGTVEVGDTVLAGDVVVSGLVEDSLGKISFRHARADVIAEIRDTITVEVPLYSVQARETGETVKRSSFQIMGLKFPLHIPTKLREPYSTQRQNHQLEMFSIRLPLWIWSEEYTLMEEVPITYNEEEAKALALRELSAIENVRFGGGEILEKTAQGKTSGDTFVMDVNYVCLMDIGRQKEILVADSDMQTLK